MSDATREAFEALERVGNYVSVPFEMMVQFADDLDTVKAALQSQTAPAPPSVAVPEQQDSMIPAHFNVDECRGFRTGYNHLRSMLAAPQPDHIADAGKVVPEGPIPALLYCPECGELHVDEYEWAKRPHKTHQCQSCGCEWRPFSVATVGIDPFPAPTADAGKVVQTDHEETDCIELLGMMARITPDRPPHTVALTKEQALSIYEEAERLRNRAVHFSFWPAFYHASRYFGRLCGPATPSVPENEKLHKAIADDLELWLSQVRYMEGLSAHDIIESAEDYISILRTAGDEGEGA